MDLAIAIGNTLRKFRKEANLSQEALALICGIDRTYVSGLERGKRQPTLKVIFAISSAIKIPPSVFVENVEREYYSG